MKLKTKKIVSWLAVIAFLLALAINVKVTLDDPFQLLSETAIAQNTNTNTNNSSRSISSRTISSSNPITDTRMKFSLTGSTTVKKYQSGASLGASVRVSKSSCSYSLGGKCQTSLTGTIKFTF